MTLKNVTIEKPEKQPPPPLHVYLKQDSAGIHMKACGPDGVDLHLVSLTSEGKIELWDFLEESGLDKYGIQINDNGMIRRKA